MMNLTRPILRRLSQRVAQPALRGRQPYGCCSLVALTGPSIAQAIPAATASSVSTGFTVPSLAGTLQYAVSASQSLATNYLGNAGVTSSTNLSGDLAFITNSALYPFNTVFSGGRSWSSSGQSSYEFFNLSMTQGIHAQRCTFNLSDSVNYLPGNRNHRPLRRARSGRSGGQSCAAGHNLRRRRTTRPGVLTGFSSRAPTTAHSAPDARSPARPR